MFFLNRRVFLLLLAMISLAYAPSVRAADVDRSLPPEMKGEEIALPLKGAVELAIKRNLDVISQKYQVDIALERITEVRGSVFDPFFKTTFEGGHNEYLKADTNYPNGYYAENNARGGIQLGGTLFTGTRYDITLNAASNESTSQAQTLSPMYSSSLFFSLTQPLLRDFGIDITKTKIKIAEKGLTAARYEAMDQLVKSVEQVEEAYWTIVYALKNVEMQKEGLDLAKEAFKIAQMKVAAGEVAPASLIEAQAGMADMEGRWVTAQGDLQKAEYDLKLLIDASEAAGRIHPVDLPAESFGTVPSVSESLLRAYESRPDIKAISYRIEQKRINEKYLSNQRLPKLDLKGTYGYTGLSGDPSNTRDANGTRLGERVTGTPYDGRTDWEDSFYDYFGNDDKSWAVTLTLEVPLGGREAKGRYKQAHIDRISSEHSLVKAKEMAGNEVRKSILDIHTSLKVIEAAKAFRKHTEEQMNIEKRKLLAGETSFYSFLERQRDFTEAKVKEIRAMIAQNIFRSKLRATEGISLSQYGIEVDMGK